MKNSAFKSFTVLAALLLIVALSGCGSVSDDKASKNQEEVVTEGVEDQPSENEDDEVVEIIDINEDGLINNGIE